ncbi:MAG TPA: hypothetical protein VG370_16555 [Chloroflexota bacterium]|nr:hypothetical protein [Chloroflexota bacterium]
MTGRARLFLLAALALALTLLAPSGALAAESDFAVQNGWFFTQAGGGGGRGYAVTDDGGVAFWRDYQRLGGVRTLGYPASWRFVGPDGFIYQATQAALLQWRPDEERAVLANSFDTLSDANRDDWLRTARAIPPSVGDDGSRGDAARSAAIRISWLEDEGIRGYYFANPNPAAFPEWPRQRAIELYGLPTSRPQRLGPFVVQRFQRVALQRWVEEVPGMPPVGSVVRVLGGDLLKEAGLLPGQAVLPAAADSARARFDSDLLARLNLLAELPAGQPLHAIAMQAPVAFVWAPLAPEVGGLFSARRRWIAINVRWREADPKAIATVLGHELSHLRDVIERKPLWTQAGCFETEQTAFRAQAAIWEAFYGPRGKRDPGTEIERQQNYILAGLKDQPEEFAQRVLQIYRHECGQLLP